MFKELGQLTGLLRNLPRLREEAEKLQQRLGQVIAEGDAGGGLVHVRVNGRMEVLNVTFSDEALRMNDRELLEEMVRSAMNQALTRARQQIAEETGKMASAMGLPPGMGLPGLT